MTSKFQSDGLQEPDGFLNRTPNGGNGNYFNQIIQNSDLKDLRRSGKCSGEFGLGGEKLRGEAVGSGYDFKMKDPKNFGPGISGVTPFKVGGEKRIKGETGRVSAGEGQRAPRHFQDKKMLNSNGNH